jgi:hypothetical protein
MITSKRAAESLVERLNAATGPEEHLDPGFTAVYGLPLAARRERFLREEHSGWTVFGRWALQTFFLDDAQEYDDVRPISDFVWRILDAGIFFDYDLSEHMVDNHATGGHLQEEALDVRKPSHLLRLLYVRPHLRKMLRGIYEDAVDLETGAAEDLVHMLKFMTPEERGDFANEVAMGMDSLYQRTATGKNDNAAWMVFRRRGEWASWYGY